MSIGFFLHFIHIADFLILMLLILCSLFKH